MAKYLAGEYDCVVIGAGHAGCEAALAAARLSARTLLLTLTADAVGYMPCNPSIGGTSKGHLVRELDALGGQMGITADATRLQTRMLNTAKGPAVHSLRAQMDKQAYQNAMRHVIERQPNLTLCQGEAASILTENGKTAGVQTLAGACYRAPAVVLAAGVYLNARILTGEVIRECGPNGFLRAGALSGALKSLGIPLQRFKTGTPPRVAGKSLDYAKMERQQGDMPYQNFSFLTPPEQKPQQDCFLVYTNAETHRVIQENLHLSPLYAGVIEGTGTRYCPSIEDKVVRFADKDRHQLFVEPEGLYTDERYVQGFSTSLPEEVQLQMLRTLPGFAACQMVRPGYAIEYDCLDPLCLNAAMGVKDIPGLFSAGQLNGTSGYEEAAAQGLIAGINAALYCQQKPPFTVSRTEGYIGVLIDDLVVKGTREPYRMMTSRAEFRLSLRQDNADLRLTPYALALGLATPLREQVFTARKNVLETARQALQAPLSPVAYKKLLERLPGARRLPGWELLRQEEISYSFLLACGEDLPELSEFDRFTLETDARYEGYLQKQAAHVKEVRRLEGRSLPRDLPYVTLPGLRKEAAQKLMKHRPATVGEASRISGVNPADIAVLLVHLERLFETQTTC